MIKVYKQGYSQHMLAKVLELIRQLHRGLLRGQRHNGISIT